MTLIVGIKCQDGIVLGSDSAATMLTTTGERTSMQPMNKLDIIAEKIILGVSGPVGLAQLFKEEIETLWNNKEFSGARVSNASAMVKLSNALRIHLNREFQFAGEAKKAIPDYLVLPETLTQTLIAVPINKSPRLIEFTKMGSPEEKNEKLPTVAIGSAQQIVDPFLGFLRRIFWPNKLPTLAEGKLAAYLALDYGIKSAPGGVGDPKTLAVLEKRQNECYAHLLSDSELNEQAEAVDGIEKYIKDFRPMKEGEGVKNTEPPEPKTDTLGGYNKLG